MDPEPQTKNLPLAIWPDWTPKVLAYMTTLGLFSCLGALYVVPIPEANEKPLLLLLGSVVTAWLMVMAYYYSQSAANVSREAVKANTEAQVSTNQKVTTTTETTQEAKPPTEEVNP